MTVIDWVPVEQMLPRDRQRVLIHTNCTNVFGYDDEPIRIHVASFVRGRTADEVERSRVIRFGDQDGNNLVPYAWSGDGPMTWFGQEVTHWAPVGPPVLDLSLWTPATSPMGT